MRVKYDLYSDKMLDLMEEQLQYYRDHIDIFVETAFAPVKLTRDQKIMLRAAGRNQDIKEVCSRGFGKTFLAGLFALAIGCLYPGAKIICVSSTAPQATLVLQKIKMLAEQNRNIANEIKPNNAKNLIQLGTDKARCVLKNGSVIESFALEATRGLDAQLTIADEVLDIDQDDLESKLAPTRNRRRHISITYEFPDMKPKALFITSACPKANPFFDTYMKTVRMMANGKPGYFACAFDVNAAIANGINDPEFIEKERERMPESTFMQEYGTIFIGQKGDSAFPYSIVNQCRTLTKIELEQPKNSKSRYVISLDIATSEAKGSDNTIFSVIKFTEKSDGTFSKKLVYMRAFNGKKLDFLADELRKLYHCRFPNAEAIVFDARGIGDALPRLMDKEWIDITTGKEYPPLVVDDKPNHNSSAWQVLHPVRAVNSLNQRMYTNLRVNLEQRTLELPITKAEMELNQAALGPGEKKLSMEERDVFLQTDALQYELSNVRGKVSASGNVLYDVWKGGLHKDRYSSLSYGVDYICELEKESLRHAKQTNVVVGVLSALD